MKYPSGRKALLAYDLGPAYGMIPVKIYENYTIV